jgi:2-polyprenyl-6-methoxyphenol hydroxylase-like FAD-dependent oxidoreductase
MEKQADDAAATPNQSVLVLGASFAGLTTAYWLNRLGYKVTVVEIAKDLKKGGTPVNIGEKAKDILKRMGLLEQVQANRCGSSRMPRAPTLTGRSNAIHFWILYSVP